MGKLDKRVEAYIKKSAPFAQPILKHIREVVHAACPDAEETIKWGFPHFIYGDGTLCSMAAFKAHCAFCFWKGALLRESGLKVSDEAMGQMGRLTSVGDLVSKTELGRLVKQAMKLNDAGIKVVRLAKKRAPIPVPADLAAARAKNRKARPTFEGFAPSHRREYLEWVTEAKRPETRAKRLAQTIEWLDERERFHLDPAQSTAQVYVSACAAGRITGHTIVRVEKGEAGLIGLFESHGYRITLGNAEKRMLALWKSLATA